MTKVDWSKPIQRKDGREAVYIGVMPDKRRVVAIHHSDGWRASSCDEGGCRMGFDNSIVGIVNIPPKPKKMFVNVYRRDSGEVCMGECTYASVEDATRSSSGKDGDGSPRKYIKTIEFEVE